MLITLLFFSSLSYSAHEQVCRSWEGAQPASQPKLASGNIPYHRRHAQFINEGWPDGRNALFFLFFMNPFFARSLNFSGSLVLFGSATKFTKSMSSRFRDCCLGTGCKSVTRW